MLSCIAIRSILGIDCIVVYIMIGRSRLMSTLAMENHLSHSHPMFRLLVSLDAVYDRVLAPAHLVGASDHV